MSKIIRKFKVFHNDSQMTVVLIFTTLDELFNLFKSTLNLPQDHPIEVFTLEEDACRKLESLSQIEQDSVYSIRVISDHFELNKREDSGQFFLLDDKEPKSQKFTMEQYIQADEKNTKENKESQTLKVEVNSQSANTNDNAILEDNEAPKNHSLEAEVEYEIRNAVTDLINSDPLYKSQYESNFELNEKVNENLFQKMRSFYHRTSAIKDSLLVEEVKNEFENHPKKLVNENLPIFEEKCDMCLRMPLHGYKFICMLCETFTMCEDCESKHGHPSYKIKYHCISEIETITKLVELAQRPIKKKGFFSKAKEMLFGKGNNFKAEVRTSKGETDFYTNPNTEFSFEIEIQNTSQIRLPQNTFMICLNTRDFNFLILRVEGIFEPMETVKSTLKCITPNKLGTYTLRLVFFHHSFEIDCEPIEIKIHLGIDQNAYLNDFFKNEEKLVNLSLEQKQKIFFVIDNDLSTKSAEEIALILQKHNWDTDLSIEDLVKEDVPEAKIEENVQGSG